ncbi:hypothetical protein I316_00729 [Kwoniella heveanensis BCC8398]|uniref:Uncharacterized protein n=1 Tax=Kwoniella heveanensis BCC8398 TaxID=1296120 RepID=A0A1B9H2V3_9TREE|nr:hypothetical protein I316_00729 [Kwoniella heveanensis BCC8398]
MSIQLPSPRLKTPSDYLHSLTLSPPSPFARAPTPAPTFPSASNRCGANQTAQSVQLQDYQLGCGRGSKMDGIRDAPASPAPPIVLNSPPLLPKSVPAPPPPSTSTSSPTYVLSRGYDSETKYEVDGRDRDEDEDDPLLSLATFRFPGSYITPPPAGTSSAARMAEEEQQSQDDEETLSVDDVSPTFVFRFPGSYDSASKAANDEFDLDGDAAVGVHGDIDRRKREIGVSSQLKADIPASSPYGIRTASSGGATSLVENGPQAQARLRKDQNAHPHRCLTPIEAKQLATYLTQQFSLKPKPKAKTRTISISSIPIPTINMNMNNNAQKKQKGMMERSIECAEALHDAGIRWDRSRRVMGMHLRGIWEASGGRSDLDLYVQGSFLTIAEEPHPLDDA